MGRSNIQLIQDFVIIAYDKHYHPKQACYAQAHHVGIVYTEFPNG